MSETASAALTVRPNGGRDWDLLWERYGISAVLVVVWALAALTTPNFSSGDNLMSVLRQSAFAGVVAVGMTMVITAGTFDLSVGTNLALCAWVAVSVAGGVTGALAGHLGAATAGLAGVAAALLAAVGTGLVVGTINGMLISRVRIPPFIATLGMLFIVRGFHFVLTSGQAARFNGPQFVWLGNGSIVGLPVPFVVFLICAVAGAGVMSLTSFGRYTYAIGSNPTAALVAGVPIRRMMALLFIVVGGFTGLGALLLGARLYSAGPGLEPNFEMSVVATVVLGGTRLAGGRGSMLGTVAAAILMATLTNVLNLLHADAFVQKVILGLVLLLALSIEGIRQRLAERLSRS